MNYRILVVFAFFPFLTSCSDEKVEPEYPEISQAELNRFLLREEISLKFDKVSWSFSIHDMQASGNNCFVNFPAHDSIAIASGLSNPDGRYFNLNAAIVPFNDDIDALTKHFSPGYKAVGCSNKYSIIMNDPRAPNSTAELLRVRVVKQSPDTELYWNYKRKIKVWFLLDFNIKDGNTGAVIERIRNAKYINEFFLIDFTSEQLNSGRVRFDHITNP